MYTNKNVSMYVCIVTYVFTLLQEVKNIKMKIDIIKSLH